MDLSSIHVRLSLRLDKHFQLLLYSTVDIVLFYAFFKEPYKVCQFHIMALGDYILTPCGLLTILWYLSEKAAAWQHCQAELSFQGAQKTEGERKSIQTKLLKDSLTLIINYVCFCFSLPQALTTQLLAVKDKRTDEKAIFIKQYYPSKRVRWMCNGATEGLLKVVWKDQDLYVFNRKRVSSTG